MHKAPEEYRPAELKGFVFDYLIEKDYEIDVYADEVLEERIRMMLGTKSTNPIRDSIAIGKEGIFVQNVLYVPIIIDRHRK